MTVPDLDRVMIGSRTDVAGRVVGLFLMSDSSFQFKIQMLPITSDFV